MKLTPEMLVLPITDDVRHALQQLLARDAANTLAEDRCWRFDVAMNGLKGVANVSDEDLVSDALDCLDWDSGVESED
jgi:hypothetical protein